MLKLSVSAIGTFEKCPKKYFFNYIDKPKIIKQKHNFTEFGSCAHQILENFHNFILENPDSSQDDWPLIMKESFISGVKQFDINLLSSETWSPKGMVPGIKLLKDIMQTYLDKIRDEGMPEVVGIETSYLFKINENASIRGYIDRIDRISDGVYRVVDYKTSKSEKYLTNFQLLVYAEAVKRMFSDVKRIEASYMMLKHDCREVVWSFTDIDYKDCNKKLEKRSFEIINEKKWIKKPSMLCQWCDFKSICQDSWSED
tara:strand:- start:4702 stop:5472 length:771 start_codon:yes stop_codon:yes gene_type:complete